jgi:hypothetical protein
MAGAKNGDFCCFEILGFDIFLDEKLSPWLIEVNHSPSFNTDTLLDKVVKTKLITETMKLLSINPQDRVTSKKIEKAKAMERIKGKSEKSTTPVEIEPSREEIHTIQNEKEELVMGEFYRIYPVDGHEEYDPFIEFSLKMAMKAGDPLALSTLTKVLPIDRRALPSGSSTARPKSSLSLTNSPSDKQSVSPRAQSATNENNAPLDAHAMAPLSPRANKPKVQSRYMSYTKKEPVVREPVVKPQPVDNRTALKPTQLILDLPMPNATPAKEKKPVLVQSRSRPNMQYVFD